MNSTTPRMGSMQNNRALPFDFNIGELFSESWQRVKGAKAPIWAALLFIILVMIGFSILLVVVGAMIPDHHIAVFLSGLIQVADVVVTYPLLIGLAYLGLRRTVDLPLRWTMIFSMYHYFWRILGMMVLQMIIVYGLSVLITLSFIVPEMDGLSLTGLVILRLLQAILIIVDIYLIFSFSFVYLLIVEKNLGVWKAFAASFFAFSQHPIKIMVAIVLMLIIYFLSALPLGIGLIWTIPMISVFMGILYRGAFGVEEVRR